MAKRNERQKTGSGSVTGGAASGSVMDAVEQQVVAFAEQLGRIAGTVQAKAEGWMDREALRAQISNVRDRAADLLEQLGGGATEDVDARLKGSRSTTGAHDIGAATTGNKPNAAPRGAAKKARAGTATASAKAKGRSGGVVDAPGKRHRKPLPNPAAALASNARTANTMVSKSRIAKMKLTSQTRGRGRG
jgi:hypothetical protein